MAKRMIASLIFAGLFALPAGAVAQAPATQPRLSPQAAAAPPIEVEQQARSAEFRRQWLGSGHRATHPPAGTCQVTAGKIVTTKLNAAIQPAAPEVSVTYQNCNPGLLEIDAYFNSVSAPSQFLETSFTVGSTNAPSASQGTTAFKHIGNPYGFGQFNPYSAAGTWTLRYLYIYDRTGAYTAYDTAALTPLFNTVNLTLVNNRASDTTPPQINSGQILTPQVSLSSHPYFFANLDISDDVSGLQRAYVSVLGPGGSPQVLYYNYPHLPFRHTTVKAYDYMGNQTKTGTWTIYSVQACDVASNCTTITGAGIQGLFGTNTFQVVN